MYKRQTIDSATLFNKGLEMIEARWLFDVPMEKVEDVYKRQVMETGCVMENSAAPQPLFSWP